MKLSYSGHKCIEAIQIQRMEAISFLAAGLSHDINNLLTGVLHYTYAIERMNFNMIYRMLDILIKLKFNDSRWKQNKT